MTAQFTFSENIDGRSVEKSHYIQKKITTIGSETHYDVFVRSTAVPGLLFTMTEQDQGYELNPSSLKIKLNGRAIYRSQIIQSCDRVEWPGGAGVFLFSSLQASASGIPKNTLQSLNLLQNLAVTLQNPGSVPMALQQTLDAWVEMAGAETGYLLSEMKPGAGWEFVASRQISESGRPERSLNRKELMSHTILNETIRLRAPIYIENMIGHPMSEALSVIEARIFSAACIPLCLGERIFGAVFLMTRSPGRSIRREVLTELSLLATQAALMLGTRIELKTVQIENARLRGLVETRAGSSMVSESVLMVEVTRKIQKLKNSKLNIMILGETGTGKELVAQEIHRGTRKGAFVAVNCAAIPATLLESTLFGVEKGAFTGALKSQDGKFVQAHEGTLFLDEIGDLPLDLQAKLLRVLQENRVEPVGSNRSVAIDLRVLSATHVDLEAAVREGRFRKDLFFRLAGSTIKLPALREREGDIQILAEYFLRQHGADRRLFFNAEALKKLSSYSWPGNIRELEQVIHRAVVFCEELEIQPTDIELHPVGIFDGESSGFHEDFRSLEDAQNAFTKEYVDKTIQQNSGSRTAAARRLGISERTLYRILATDSSGRTL